MKIAERVKGFSFKAHAATVVSAVCAFGVMFLHPLIYQNFYFNINRFKLLVYLIGAFAALAAYAPFAVMNMNGRFDKRRFTLADMGMAAFCLTAAVSCALSDNPLKALSGADGRYGGLVFMLALAAAYACVSRGRHSAKAAAYGLLISGALCSLLGIVNFYGYDPLGFADRLSSVNTKRFISTIGNIDFFGAFLCLSLSCAAVTGVRGGSATSILSLPCAALSAGAVVAARADAALIALPFACLAAILAGLRSLKHLSRAFAVISAVCAGLCLMGVMCLQYIHYLSVADHACKHIIANPTAFFVAAFVSAILSLVLANIRNREICKTARICVYSFLALVALCAAGFALQKFIYYTYIDTQTELTGLMRLFRFSDTWGTYRGGVWTRCLKLYAQSDLRVQLVGFGPDCLKLPLKEAYGAEIAAYSGLSFDNAHNEPIQYLLTLGALGLAGYLTFLVGALARNVKRAKSDFGSAALLAAAVAYLIYSLVNVNQPITTPLLFMALSAGVGVETQKNE